MAEQKSLLENDLPNPTLPSDDDGQETITQATLKPELTIASTNTILCGIQWDKLNETKSSDIDISCIILDEYSFQIGVVYFNEISLFNNAISHSGDNKTGVGDGIDESITIKLNNLPQNIKSIWIMVNMHSNNTTFSDVESASCVIKSLTNSIYNLNHYTGLGSYGNDTSLCVGCLYKQNMGDNYWYFKEIEKAGKGKNFVESSYLYVNELTSIYDEYIILDRPNDKDINYDLKKGDNYIIDKSIKTITVGLGWDPSDSSRNIDVDASILVLDDKLERIATVYYGNKTYSTWIEHSGDNLTGKGDGDDEKIFVRLSEIPKNNEYNIIVLINIFSGSASFSNIDRCFCRLVDENKKQLCKFNLTQECKGQGMFMCHLFRKKNGCWALKAMGNGINGRKADDCMDDVKKILNGQEVIINTNQGSSNVNSDDCCCVVL